MKRYTIFHVPVMAFFSKALYQDACHRWRGTGFGYLLFLLAVCWIPLMVVAQLDFSQYVAQEAPKIINQIPEVTIRDGKASIDESQPYVVTEPETGQKLAIFDMTGQVKSLADTDARILVTETELIYQKNKIETRSFSFRGMKEDFTLTRDLINHWMAIAVRWAVPVAYPFVVLASFLFRMIQLLVYAAIGLLFAQWCGSRRAYGELLRLTAVAVTPCILLGTVFQLAGWAVPFQSLWFFAITMAYLYFGIKASAETPEINP